MKRHMPVILFIVSLAGSVFASGPLQVVPSEFDFGWCPDDARVSARFSVRNIGSDVVPVTKLEPSCGCTSADFNPTDLASNDESTLTLTFNTFGFIGARFNKTADLRAGTDDKYTVRLKGAVADDLARVRPEGTGVAAFAAGKTGTQKITIRNNTGADVTVEMIQGPADWAAAKMSGQVIKAGGTATVTVTLKKAFTFMRETSATFEAVESARTHRFTVGIRSGVPTVRRPKPAAPSKPVPAPK